MQGLIGGVLASEVWWQSLRKAQNWGNLQFIWLGLRALLSALRAVHEVIWGLLFLNIIGLNPLTAILAIAIPFGAIIAKVYSEIPDEMPRQPLQALLNSGVSAPKAFLYRLLPQAYLDMLSYSFYRFEWAIRSAAVLGIIGAGGLGPLLIEELSNFDFQAIGAILIVFIGIILLMDLISSIARKHFRLEATT